MRRKAIGATEPSHRQMFCSPRSKFLLFTTEPKLFIRICSFLPPRDLFSLSQVSKRFRSLLCSQDSRTVQSIWKTSRTSHLYYPKLPPPDDMDERHYVLLTNLAVKCQFCCHPKKQSKVFWAFGVRCCVDCFHQRTVSEHRLLTHYKIPKESLCGLPYTSPCNYKIYWGESVAQSQRDYSAAIESNSLENYLHHQRHLRISLMQQVRSYELEYKSELIKWNLHNNAIIEDIRLRSSCMAEEVASNMELDVEKLMNLGIYWYPIEQGFLNASKPRDVNIDNGNKTEDNVESFSISDKEWKEWRKKVESKCRKFKRSSSWFNRFSIISVKD